MSMSGSRWLRWFSWLVAAVALFGAGALADGLRGGSAPAAGAVGETGLSTRRDLTQEQSGGPSHEDESSVDVGGESHVEEEEEAAVVADLSPAELMSIGLTTQSVGTGPVEATLRFPGAVRMHPDGVAVLGTRIQGKIVSVAVSPGDRVRQGQVLARIQSLVPGNPPPTVDLRAPIAGVVARRDATVGEAARPNKELFRLIDPSRVVAEARVPERVVERVRPRQAARFRLLRDDRWWTGQVSFIGSEVNPSTRTYPVWITLSANGPPLPRAGQFGEILLIESRRTALTVPSDAVVAEGPLRFVFVRREHGFERRLIRTGIEGPESVEIVSGLSPGDIVAVTGSYELMLSLRSGGPGAADAESVPHGH